MKRQIAIISALTLTAQFSAFVKLWFTARVFGLGSELDGYNLALILPTLVASSVSGIVQTGLFPVRARLAIEKGGEDIAAFERAVLLCMAGVGLVLSLGLLLTLDSAAAWVAGDAPPAVLSAFKQAFAPLIALLFLNILGDCAGYLLAMRNKFPIAAAAPIANGIIGALILAFSPEGALHMLVASTLVGLLLQVGICFGALPHAGLKFFGPLPNVAGFVCSARTMVTLGVLGFPGVLLSNLVLSLPQVWIAGFGEGAVSAFGYAIRLHLAVIQLVIMASSTVLLARLADLVSSRQVGELRRVLAQANRAAWGVGLAGILVVWALGEPVLSIMLNGRFTPEDAHRVASHWTIISFGIPFAIVGAIYSKLWQARGKPVLLVLGPAVNLTGMWITFSFTASFLGEYSSAAAMSSGAAMAALVAVVTERILYRADEGPATP
ncbi:lipid II flippase MurJ [Hyphomicrobium sulfonivorans]|uniref:lipid II flippase MurJ n=1 Tax=Hyphomicrobium sulfonivorans TaxID=121290 RepID=UPI00156FF350|nr:lipid II flippase MurJ [Hyphomicrobium sulfonivorans]MBI1649848.1 hypothetical protein [Hyphomicrobium sulfonivorans]NSL71761.1 hypothetical protein [Hyphomicrobium sulfonivorans]